MLVDSHEDTLGLRHLEEPVASISAVSNHEYPHCHTGVSNAFGPRVVADPVPDVDACDELNLAHNLGNDRSTGGFECLLAGRNVEVTQDHASEDEVHWIRIFWMHDYANHWFRAIFR